MLLASIRAAAATQRRSLSETGAASRHPHLISWKSSWLFCHISQPTASVVCNSCVLSVVVAGVPEMLWSLGGHRKDAARSRAFVSANSLGILPAALLLQSQIKWYKVAFLLVIVINYIVCGRSHSLSGSAASSVDASITCSLTNRHSKQHRPLVVTTGSATDPSSILFTSW